MMEWISVEDRLPEYSKHVLVVWGKDRHVAAGAVYPITRHIGKDSPIDDRWFLYPSRSGGIKPTHWMPLPEPPK